VTGIQRRLGEEWPREGKRSRRPPIGAIDGDDGRGESSLRTKRFRYPRRGDVISDGRSRCDVKQLAGEARYGGDDAYLNDSEPHQSQAMTL
jgi:hypothetical protein